MQNVNQFSQSYEKGLIDTKIGGLILSCKVYTGNTLEAGQPVKLVDSGNGIPEIQALAAATDAVFGFIVRDYKKSSHVAGDTVEVLVKDGIMHMEASEAIARGAEVAPVLSGVKVESADATDRIVGVALDKAAADGDLIRVLVTGFGGIKA